MDKEKEKTKKCKFCEHAKPANREFFFQNRHNQDGLMNVCKECTKVAIQLYMRNEESN